MDRSSFYRYPLLEKEELYENYLLWLETIRTESTTPIPKTIRKAGQDLEYSGHVALIKTIEPKKIKATLRKVKNVSSSLWLQKTDYDQVVFLYGKLSNRVDAEGYLIGAYDQDQSPLNEMDDLHFYDAVSLLLLDEYDFFDYSGLNQ